ncbi:hypothetical protein H9635_05325 [Solibacillus sp. A46]|uniref:Chemotaxis protein n=1 Tax=Solibacillus faecavium TaxID=2762221 RepID=A0ABR8XW59_9BACL|nr:hypothetical protein [Solibacillus faecavium]MBD8036155.1 hypothetical protein [Solibacillus faecavium]
MPLPFIPLVIAGAVAASTAVASKKGYDSYKNMKETKELAEELHKKYTTAYDAFDSMKEQTNEQFEHYGKLKLDILNETMKHFIKSFKQIKHIEFKNESEIESLVNSADVDQLVVTIEKQVVKAGQVLTAGVASLAGGGLAAMGAVGATTTFAAASTGTAIASLSGIAAQNATLAFLGGGSLATGGLGIAGGTMVLGGIALAPALALGSLIFAATTEKKLEKMYEKKAEVNAEVQKLTSASAVLTRIEMATKNMYDLADGVKKVFDREIKSMDLILSEKGLDFRKYTKEDQQTIHKNYKLAVITRDILNISILTDKGDLVPNLQQVITTEKRKIQAL